MMPLLLFQYMTVSKHLSHTSKNMVNFTIGNWLLGTTRPLFDGKFSVFCLQHNTNFKKNANLLMFFLLLKLF